MIRFFLVCNGEKKNTAVTQFAPVDARRCFPCWDEPAFKVSIHMAIHLSDTVSVKWFRREWKWIVPITVSCGSYASQKKFLLKTKSEKLDVPELTNLISTSDGSFWIKLNVDQTGFYRVKYDDVLAAGLRSAIEANQLSPTDRFGILDDAFALSMACKQTLSFLLSSF
ncbi:hypothetical protein ZIOFF_045192 [Zingiber officinale]|uniref:Uncharacterized protein n=1 Tax=Zingiber officinale TaxID=94328 RepID=A0A8J5G6H7_ZINOF|nr:hypothetical protein ZIOFF_045192 [Zingiber officinale]